jgi:tRNA G18 (ribose-2'-O)-methylase SpoU
MYTLRKIRQKEREQAQRLFEKQKRNNHMSTPGPLEYVVILDSLKPSFNIGKIFRTADAFGANSVHLIGIDFFDPTPAKGSFKWVPTVFHKSFADCYWMLHKLDYTFFVLEPEEGDVLQHADMPQKSAFIFGHEEFGVSFDKKDYPSINSLRIPQFGKVQSLNVSIAAAVVMYEYTRQHASSDLLNSIPQKELTAHR